MTFRMREPGNRTNYCLHVTGIVRHKVLHSEDVVRRLVHSGSGALASSVTRHVSDVWQSGENNTQREDCRSGLLWLLQTLWNIAYTSACDFCSHHGIVLQAWDGKTFSAASTVYCIVYLYFKSIVPSEWN